MRSRIVLWGNLAWRILAIGAVIYFSFRVLLTVSVIVISVILALFLAAVLWAPTSWLRRHGWRPAPAAFATILASALALTGMIVFIIPQVLGSLGVLGSDLAELRSSTEEWLITGPLGLSEAQIEDYTDQVTDWLGNSAGESIIGGAAAVIEFVTGAFLAVIVTFFILKDGERLFDRALALVSSKTAERAAVAARVGRKTLAQYMGGVALIGLFDAILIGIALWVIGTPLAFPLALLVFFGAFIPLVGAFVSGLLAVGVTVVNVGLAQGLIVLAVVVVIQQFEGDVIMPLVFGRTLRLHPLLVLLAVTVGGLAFGLVGAFLAVPLIAVAVSISDEISDDPESSLWSLSRG